MNESQRRARRWSGAGAAVVAACALCCAGPLLAILGSIGIGSAVGAIWLPGLAALTVVAAIGALWLRRRRRASICQAGRVDVSMPTIGKPGWDTAPTRHL
ncbi:hypothetical protein MGALJ_60350 (plasmid) [Mycobacterium gallinarum]|uniref:Mercury transporter n=1 Tax=Mycobacterium gallinarum TaxID=39689 RepID=A0A9W4B960_9MYCO|nr:hypothetical protein [Mycobacterium gallinarum]BBY96366.1 hypothetical protein MGALJ_60350 [Mycobacterium gallinarum]